MQYCMPIEFAIQMFYYRFINKQVSFLLAPDCHNSSFITRLFRFSSQITKDWINT